MTYLASAAQYLATWVGRANQAWGASRVWNSGTSFETDSSTWHGRADSAWGATRVWNSGSSFEADVTTWAGRANQAWGVSRVWSSGTSFETDAATNLSAAQTWQARANQAWGATRVWNSGSSFETDSSTWNTRANSAWGASRVWNSGSSFESDAATNLANSNTWQTRANQAWGSSRVWNSGESWEAAYNRVYVLTNVHVLDATLTLPATGFNNPIVDGQLGSINAPLGGHDPAALYVGAQNITIKSTGTYIVFVTAAFQGTANYHTRVQIQVNNVTVADAGDQQNSLSAQNVTYYRTITYRGNMNAGDVVRVCGGFSTGSAGATGNMMLAKQSL